MRRTGITAVAGLLLALTAADVQAQRPRFGVGLSGGIFFGTRILDHTSAARAGGETVETSRRVHVDEVGLASAHAEWYATPHVALRLHGAWGSGAMRAAFSAPEGMSARSMAEGPAEPAGLGELGDVRMTALDAGVSLWPVAPRGSGFAPFITVGLGVVRYDFAEADASGQMLAVRGERSRRSVLLGAGADMLVWEGVTLRLEAMNHRARSPLSPADFAGYGADAAAADAPGAPVSNVRLVVGAHVYFPFRSGSIFPQ